MVSTSWWARTRQMPTVRGDTHRKSNGLALYSRLSGIGEQRPFLSIYMRRLEIIVKSECPYPGRSTHFNVSAWSRRQLSSPHPSLGCRTSLSGFRKTAGAYACSGRGIPDFGSFVIQPSGYMTKMSHNCQKGSRCDALGSIAEFRVMPHPDTRRDFQ